MQLKAWSFPQRSQDRRHGARRRCPWSMKQKPSCHKNATEKRQTENFLEIIVTTTSNRGNGLIETSGHTKFYNRWIDAYQMVGRYFLRFAAGRANYEGRTI